MFLGLERAIRASQTVAYAAKPWMGQPVAVPCCPHMVT